MILLHLDQQTHNQQVTKNPTLRGGVLSFISWWSGMACLDLPRLPQLRSTSRNYIYTT